MNTYKKLKHYEHIASIIEDMSNASSLDNPEAFNVAFSELETDIQEQLEYILNLG